MTIIKKILSPTDCSDPSIDASKLAVELAKKLQAELIVMHVIPPPGTFLHLAQDYHNVYKHGAGIDSMAKDHLEKHWKSISGNDIDAELTVVRGDPFSEIIKYAKNNMADIIVMGTHGHTGLKHLMMGSVAEKVVRYSSLPVLTVKHKGYEYFAEPDHE